MLFPPLNKPPELATGGEKGTAAGAHNPFAFVGIGEELFSAKLSYGMKNRVFHTIATRGTAVTNFVPCSARRAFCCLTSAAIFQGRISR
jgi:hypothetical protein